jgi:acetate kinase
MMILTVNTGSSSVRLGLFENNKRGLAKLDERHVGVDKDEPEKLLKQFLGKRLSSVQAAAHRVVHGGATFTRSCLINEQVSAEIDRLSPLAPLHNPLALTWVRICSAFFSPKIPQIAVFDTSFYAEMPHIAKIYALPKDLCNDHGIVRYGFHGIAHKFMLRRLEIFRPDCGAKGKIISIQLGSGCSMTAIKDSRPVDTSMGFSPLEGLMMSTRSGDIDPAVQIYLQKEAGVTVDEIDRLLNRSSGLIGVSGLSSDMKTLLASDDQGARVAVDLYCYRVKKYVGAYMAALGGADCILFGGGAGEHSPQIRSRILKDMEWCGIEINEKANNATIGKEGEISSKESAVDVYVVTVDEAYLLAEEAVSILQQ